MGRPRKIVLSEVPDEPKDENVAYNQVKAREVETAVAQDDPEYKEKMDDVLKGVEPKGRHVVVEVKGGFRVVNKRKQWVTPIITFTEANKLCSDMNIKDPEQKPGNASIVRKEGFWNAGA